MTAPTATAVADAPTLLHGEMDANPSAVPSMTSTIDAETAPTAPPTIAAQLTAEREDSRFAVSNVPARAESIELMCRLLVPDQREKDDHGNRYPEQPEQNAPTHCFLQRFVCAATTCAELPRSTPCEISFRRRNALPLRLSEAGAA